MFRVTIVSDLVSRVTGKPGRTEEVCRDANEVKRYLHGRVREVKPEVGTYTTLPARGRMWRPGDPEPMQTVTVGWEPRVGG